MIRKDLLVNFTSDTRIISCQFNSKSREDIQNIWLYSVEKWSVQKADRYIQVIFEEVQYVLLFPTLGKDFGHVRENYRCSKVKLHLIFYRFNHSLNEIEMVGILQQRMDI